MSAYTRLFIRLTDEKEGEKETTFLLNHREELLEKTVLVIATKILQRIPSFQRQLVY